MNLHKILTFSVLLFALTFTSCKKTKKEAPKVDIETEKLGPQNEEESVEEDFDFENLNEETFKKGDNEIEESEEELDTLSNEA